jgi:hypothetical protein
MHNAENEDLESMLFKWFCQDRSVTISVDGSMTKTKANHFAAHSMICLLKESFTISKQEKKWHKYTQSVW